MDHGSTTPYPNYNASDLDSLAALAINPSTAQAPQRVELACRNASPEARGSIDNFIMNGRAREPEHRPRFSSRERQIAWLGMKLRYREGTEVRILSRTVPYQLRSGKCTLLRIL